MKYFLIRLKYDLNLIPNTLAKLVKSCFILALKLLKWLKVITSGLSNPKGC